MVGSVDSDIASVDVSDKVVGAAALIDLRLNHPLAKRQHVCGHHDQFFWTQAGSERAAILADADPSYVPFVIARHRWFAERLLRAADQTKQILVLGAGFDGRPMSLVQLGLGALQVFEVDCPDIIEAKLDILARHRVVVPLGLHHVGAELDDVLLKAKLAAAGYRRDLPTVVLMEGAQFLLSRPTAEILLDPRSLSLATGSSVVMDFWTTQRQEAMNAKIEPRLGHQLFGESPLGESMESAALYVQDRGYGDIEVISLDRLCARYGIATERDPLPQSWLIMEAQVL